MWCAKCRADVAAEVSSDNTRVRCASCNCEIVPAQGLRSTVKTREARELLERWSSGQMLDPYSPTLTRAPSTPRPEPAPVAAPQFERAPVATAPRPEPRAPQPVVRFEAPQAAPAPVRQEPPRVQHPEPVEFEPEPRQFAPVMAPIAPAPIQRVDVSHAPTVRRPHVDIQAAAAEAESDRTDWVSIAGHLLAYGGVTLLTFGSVLVVWSQFGGPANYAPSGWLVTIFGQMLTFLGGVTLVSRNLEQTSAAVERRVAAIADRLDRMEASQTPMERATIPVSEFARPQQIQQPLRRSA